MKTQNAIKKRLTTLSRLYKIMGYVGMIFSLIMAIGGVLGPLSSEEPLDVRVVLGFIIFSAVFYGGLVSVLMLMVSRAIQQQVRHAFCVVISCILLPCFPLGTIFGAYSLCVLLEPSVKSVFGEAEKNMSSTQ